MESITELAPGVIKATKNGRFSTRLPADENKPARTIPRTSLSQLNQSHPKIKKMVDICHEWRQRKLDGYADASIVLTGPVGTGKTHVARAVLWSICYTVGGNDAGYVGKFFMASDLLIAMTPYTDGSGMLIIPRPAEVVGSAPVTIDGQEMGVPIVVIDDIGSEQTIPYINKENYSQEIRARYFRIINYCYERNISLVITSNLSIEQLGDFLGRRSWSRLGEMAPRGFMVDLTGVPDWRQRNGGRC